MSEAELGPNPKHQTNNLAASHGVRELAGADRSATAVGRPERHGAQSELTTSGRSLGEGKKSRDKPREHLKYVATIVGPADQGDARQLRRRSKQRRRIQIHRRRRHRRRWHHKHQPVAKSHHLPPTARALSPLSSHVGINELGHMQSRSTSSPLPPDGPSPSSIAPNLTRSAPVLAASSSATIAPSPPSGRPASPFNYLLLVGLPLYACLMFALIICLALKYFKNAQRAFKAGGCQKSKPNSNKIKRFIASPISFISNGKPLSQSSGLPSGELVKSKHKSDVGAAVVRGEQRKSLASRQLTINMLGSEPGNEDSDGQKSGSGNETADSRVEQAKKSKSKPAQLGRLKYSLEFDFNRNLLTVCILEAYELAPMDPNGFSDPYVNVYMANNKNYPTFRTKIHKRTLNPVFNETFTFQISYVELNKQTLILSVYDYDKLTRHDEIGQLTLPMNSIDLTQRQMNCSELRKMNDTDEGRLGDICLSLRYVPTAGRMNVVVLEARQLKKMDVAGLSDPYVKLALVSQGRRIKKKKTSIKKCTLNPHFNESFSFEVPFDQAQQVQLVVTVVDYDRIGTSEPIGTITLGYEQATSETEQRHWMDMLASPRRPIARWHTLRSIDFDPKRPVLSRRISQLINN